MVGVFDVGHVRFLDTDSVRSKRVAVMTWGMVITKKSGMGKVVLVQAEQDDCYRQTSYKRPGHRFSFSIFAGVQALAVQALQQLKRSANARGLSS